MFLSEISKGCIEILCKFTFIRSICIYEFRLLRYSILTCFIFIGIGHFFVCITAILENALIPTKNGGLWLAGVYINILGTDCIRCLFVSIFIERTVATVHSQFYEKSNKIWIAIILILVSCCLGGCLTFIKLQSKFFRMLYCMTFNILDQLLTVPFYGLGLVVDIIGCIVSYYTKYNIIIL